MDDEQSTIDLWLASCPYMKREDWDNVAILIEREYFREIWARLKAMGYEQTAR